MTSRKADRLAVGAMSIRLSTMLDVLMTYFSDRVWQSRVLILYSTKESAKGISNFVVKLAKVLEASGFDVRHFQSDRFLVSEANLKVVETDVDRELFYTLTDYFSLTGS